MDTFAKPVKGQPPYHLRPFNAEEHRRHTNLVQKLEAMATAQRVLRGFDHPADTGPAVPPEGPASSGR